MSHHHSQVSIPEGSLLLHPVGRSLHPLGKETTVRTEDGKVFHQQSVRQECLLSPCEENRTTDAPATNLHTLTQGLNLSPLHHLNGQDREREHRDPTVLREWDRDEGPSTNVSPGTLVSRIPYGRPQSRWNNFLV